jgi:hypothetical protein
MICFMGAIGYRLSAIGYRPEKAYVSDPLADS